MKLYLIRHGMTFGNTLGRYIGTTDEPLSPEGRAALGQYSYPICGVLFVSPLKRCRETAQLLYPGKEQHVIRGFAECDFGEFENKNYRELSGNPDYQRWIDSGGTMAFPGGESQESFRRRCAEAFLEMMEACRKMGADSAACVVHGGTVMSILAEYAVPREDFYHWQIKNGEGYACGADLDQWAAGIHELKICEKFSAESGKRGERQ